MEVSVDWLERDLQRHQSGEGLRALSSRQIESGDSMSRDEPTLNVTTADQAIEVWACGSNLYQQLSDDASILEIRKPVRIFADKTIARIVGISSTQILCA